MGERTEERNGVKKVGRERMGRKKMVRGRVGKGKSREGNCAVLKNSSKSPGPGSLLTLT